MPDSGNIDQAIVATLMADATLMALLPDGVWFDKASKDATRFIVISIVTSHDEAEFGGRAWEDVLYSVEAIALQSTGADVRTAAARINLLLEDVPLSLTQGTPSGVPGYTWMSTVREERIRMTEVDDQDPTIRWQRRGGRYRVMMSLT